MQTALPRNRIVLFVLIAATVTAGLATRHGFPGMSRYWLSNTGDALWAVLAYLGFACLAPRATPIAIGIAAGMTSAVIEATQLYHAPWIDAIRATTLGGLILGYGFAWSDLACYAVGISVGVGVDALIMGRGRTPTDRDS